MYYMPLHVLKLKGSGIEKIHPGIFSAILGRGPRAFCFEKFSVFYPKLGKILQSFLYDFLKQGP